jgi:hypothetical protein
MRPRASQKPGPRKAVVAISYRFPVVGARDGAMRYRLYLLVTLLVGALASWAKASDIAVPPASPAPSDWIITIGADARAVPRYMGSDARAMVPVSYFDRHRPGSPEGFHSPRDGTGIALFDNSVFAIGPVGSLI